MKLIERIRRRAWRPSSAPPPVEALNFYSKLVEPGDLCFDVGANVGDRTAIFLELGATVVAIEPQERCVAELRRRFGRRGDVTVVPAALGSTVGSAPMRVGTASTVSTMSRLWEQRVRESKRFGDTEWRDEIVVPVTTLDLVIADFGMPRFCKIDVEGYELEVLSGLSRVIPIMSFEWTPETTEITSACIDRVGLIGATAFNLSLGESMAFELENWVTEARLRAHLATIPADINHFGDVYARASVA